jgi:hypothetical protein
MRVKCDVTLKYTKKAVNANEKNINRNFAFLFSRLSKINADKNKNSINVKEFIKNLRNSKLPV